MNWLVLAWWVAATPSGPVRQDRALLSTTVSIAIADRRTPERLAPAFDEAFAVFEQVGDTMNEWKAGSALDRINSAAGTDALTAPPELCDVLARGLEGARATDGLFDPTWAALKGLWRFDGRTPPALPNDSALAQACALVGYRDLQLEASEKGCRVRLARAGMRLGLGGLAKGWAVDQAAKRLRARGLHHFFIQAGGDLYFSGRNGDRPWRAGIRDPRGEAGSVFAKLEVRDQAFSTSGDYERFFELDGVRYHHLIDLRTCRPARASRSVTVLAASATQAEWLSKAAFVLGGDAGLALLEKHGASGVIVDAANQVHVSPALRGRLELVAPPSP